MNNKDYLPEIISLNRDIEHIMYASCQWGCHSLGMENNHKRFAALIGADFHGCWDRFSSMIDYLDFYDAIDCGIQLGDLQPIHAKQDCSEYIRIVKRTNKPFLPVLGNHDVGNSIDPSICANQDEAYQKYCIQIENSIGAVNAGKNYYLRYFEKYKIAIIVLDNYESSLNRDSNGKYNIMRGTNVHSQEQIDWFINSLKNIPQDYHLIVALHSFPHKCCSKESIFTNPSIPLCPTVNENPFLEADYLSDIINAWKNGSVCKAEYHPYESFKKNCCPIQIDCDFSLRGKGNFISYIIGHYHNDYFAAVEKHPDQNILAFASSADDLWQNGSCDLPRAYKSKATDLLTVMSVDTIKNKVYLVRIGSNITTDLTNRTCFSFYYGA